MKNKSKKKITTTVIAMIFALAITMPVTSQKAEAGDFYEPVRNGTTIAKMLGSEGVTEFVCIASLILGGIAGAGALAAAVPSGGGSLLGFGAILGGFAGGGILSCSGAVGALYSLHKIAEGTEWALDKIFTLGNSTESYAVIGKQGDSEDIQISLRNSDDVPADSDAVRTDPAA